MTVLMAIALTTGILSASWMWVSMSFGLLSWAGFLGCTAYFAAPAEGRKGLQLSLLTSLSGVAWAMLIIHLSGLVDLAMLGYLVTGVVAFLMCIQAKQAWLSYIPGTFIGACATFAANGDWQQVVPALIVGGCFGYAMKASGLKLHQVLTTRQSGS